jgi:hypothetical protein
MVFQPLGFRIQPASGMMAPTYPTGLPLHLYLASRLVGWSLSVVVLNLLTVLASGGLLWALARRLGLQPIWAAASVVLLWLCPLFVFSALQPMSDLLALTWSLAVLYCALRITDHCRWGLACGVALGLAVLVRPTNALLIAPVLVAVGLHGRSFWAVGLGGLPGAAAFTFYNWRVYGSPFVTGYGDVSTAFSREFVAHNLVHFSHWIPLLLTPFIGVAVAAPFLPSVRQRGYLILATWLAALTGFYAFYYNAGEAWWYLRFILPIFPVLILGSMAVTAAAVRSAKLASATTAVAVLSLLVLTSSWQLNQSRRLEVLPFERGERSYPDAAHWAQNNLPANSVIFCLQVSGAFYYYSDFLTIRWDTVAPDRYSALLTALAEQKRPIYAALFPFEDPPAREKIGGNWIKLATVGQVTFWQRQP